MVKGIFSWLSPRPMLLLFCFDLFVQNILFKIRETDSSIFLEGPRELGKYKISSDYCKNWALLKLFDFVRVVRNIDISNLEPKKVKCFFYVF